MLIPIITHKFDGENKSITFYVNLSQDELKALLEDPLKEFGDICTIVFDSGDAGVKISTNSNDTEFKNLIKALAKILNIEDYVENAQRAHVERLTQDGVNPLQDDLSQIYAKILRCFH
jgi:hypothetical protein